MPDEGGIRGLFAVSTMHGVVAPRAVVVGRGERAVRVQQRNDVALRVKDVVVERRGRAVVVDHGERLVAIVIDKLERLAAPSLPHDLAGKRCVVVRRAVDRFAGTDAGHVVGVGDLLAVDRRGGELPSLRPREGVLLAVVIRNGVAGNRVTGHNTVIRACLALVLDFSGRAAGRDAREQIRPRGIRVADSKTLKNKFYTFHYSITFFDFCTLFLRLICYKYNFGKFRNNPQFYIPIIICFSYST